MNPEEPPQEHPTTRTSTLTRTRKATKPPAGTATHANLQKKEGVTQKVTPPRARRTPASTGRE